MKDNELKAIELLIKRYERELDGQSWFHRRFSDCSKCRKIVKKLKQAEKTLETFALLGVKE